MSIKHKIDRNATAVIVVTTAKMPFSHWIWSLQALYSFAVAKPSHTLLTFFGRMLCIPSRFACCISSRKATISRSTAERSNWILIVLMVVVRRTTRMTKSGNLDFHHRCIVSRDIVW